MRNTNVQFPFAFQKRPNIARNKTPRASFSVNIKGLCTRCAHPFQRVRKYDSLGNKLPITRCQYCAKYDGNGVVKELPKALRPWKIISRRRDYNGYFSMKFTCQGCNTTYMDFCTFGALCKHAKHIPPGGWFCRFCCTKDESTLEPPSKNKKKIELEVEIQEQENPAGRRMVEVFDLFEIQRGRILGPEDDVFEWDDEGEPF